MGELYSQKNGPQIGGHDGIPLLHRGVKERFGDLDSRIIDQGVQLSREAARFAENGFDIAPYGDIRLDKIPAFWERLIEGGPVNTNYTPTFFCAILFAKNAPSAVRA